MLYVANILSASCGVNLIVTIRTLKILAVTSGSCNYAFRTMICILA